MPRDARAYLSDIIDSCGAIAAAVVGRDFAQQGPLMKTEVTFKSAGTVTLETRNRGKGAERWITHLQGKRHIQKVK